MENKSEIIIYKTVDNQTEIEVKFDAETVWLNQYQLSDLFQTDRTTILKHIQNIYKSNELDEKITCSKFAQVQKEGNRFVKREIQNYNLDMIISVGYRVNSIRGTHFRQWATQRLRDFLVKGYAINPKRLEQNKTLFLQTLEDLKLLTQNSREFEAKDVLTLIQSFSNTWFSLGSYDRNEFPKEGSQKEILLTSIELKQDFQQLKRDLIQKGEASELFALEKNQGSFEGIFGNVFQSVFGNDAYPGIEEKAAHLLYFIVKNHPFNDGNKRCGAFAFVWFLHKAGYHFIEKISPETLTAVTILIAESNPANKEKMIGVVLLLLNKR
ncbi:type II toxin-antitoxin system death-on-curing family toxin [bacterium]|nr:type II toxin-antitoxin system death-on-curing family toxin [bacterium]